LFFAWLLLHETVTMRVGVGALAIIISCVLVALAERASPAWSTVDAHPDPV